MLADVLETNLSFSDDLQGYSDCAAESTIATDNFTGLYASGRNSCGGTMTTTVSDLKNSGYRVCRFYGGQCDTSSVYLPIIQR